MTKEELLKEHPDYTAFHAEWLFYVRSYLGGKFYREGDYLIQHAFESDDNYKRRKKVAYFYNYCQPIVDIFVSLLFKKDPERNYGSLTGDPLFESFLKDADKGESPNTYSQFIREAQRLASIYGRVSVVVDKPLISAETKAEAIDNNIRPYLTIVTPENIINWQYHRLIDGRIALKEVRVVEGRNDKGEPSIIRIWGTEGWKLFQIDEQDKTTNLSPIMAGEHGLGVVPVVPLYNKNSGVPMVGLSDIQDIAGINKNIYYLSSDAQEIIENTAFPMLAEADSGGGNDEPTLVGAKNVLTFDPDSPNSKPFWLEAPHSSLNEIREYISQHRRTIFQMANLLGIYISGESKQPPAGIALEIENQQRDAALAEKADNMEQAENKILQMYARWEGVEFDGTVNYQRDFSIRDVDMNIQNIINTLRDVNLQSELMTKGLQKQLVRSFLSNRPKAERNKIYQDIEASIIQSNGGMNNV